MTTQVIDEYLGRKSWLIKENANQKTSFSNLKAYIANAAIREYTLSKYPADIRKLHDEGWIHIHDLASGIVPYCHGADLKMLLHEGLWSPFVVANPAKHFSSALNQAVNYFFMSQQEWAGAQAYGDFNTLLAPLVSKDRLNYDEVKQYIQEMVWDLAFPGRSGFETPFTNLMFNTKCPAPMQDDMVVTPGMHEHTYADFHDESMTILQAFNEVIQKGDKDGTPFTFPIPTINLIPSTRWNDDIWHEIMETEANNGIYYFMNFIGSGLDPNSVRAMCCRLNLDLSELAQTGGRWALQGSTGSLGIVTINMAKLGYTARTMDDLLEHLTYILGKIKEALILKTEWCQEMLDGGYMPLTRHYGVNFDRYFRTVGVLGLDEMFLNFNGEPIWENLELASKIIEFIRDWTRRAQQETKMLWNIEMTPGESAATRLALIDRKTHSGIITKGTDIGPYYTTMITPPSTDMSLAERLRIEETLLPLFTGGTVHRIYMGENKPDPEGLHKLAWRIAKNFKVPYFDFAATKTVCRKCKNTTRGAYRECPECGGPTKIYNRIVGYYRDITQANEGKVNEFWDRTYVNLG
jgi:ribonucleoside-triphosphate reductase